MQGITSVHVGDNISTVGDNISTVEGIQYSGDTFSKWGIPLVSGEIPSVQWRITSVLWRFLSTVEIKISNISNFQRISKSFPELILLQNQIDHITGLNC